MSTWLDKPDGDGLWWRCIGERICLCTVWVAKGLHQIVVDSCDEAWCSREPYGIGAGAKWQRCELARPEPYKPPTPPKVTQYTATLKGGPQRFLTRVGDVGVVHELQDNGDHRPRRWTTWVILETEYTDIKPLESPP